MPNAADIALSCLLNRCTSAFPLTSSGFLVSVLLGLSHAVKNASPSRVPTLRLAAIQRPTIFPISTPEALTHATQTHCPTPASVFDFLTNTLTRFLPSSTTTSFILNPPNSLLLSSPWNPSTAHA
jgi:hypothetical protein